MRGGAEEGVFVTCFAVESCAAEGHPGQLFHLLEISLIAALFNLNSGGRRGAPSFFFDFLSREN
jgi:hypothetical protein